jgi:hypothetical protein
VEGSRHRIIALLAVTAVTAPFALHATVSAGAALDASDRNRAEDQLRPSRARPPKLGTCTMAVPPTQTTVEAQIANAADFCELVSQALAADIFRAPVIVTPGRLWHYTGAALSCRLRYGATPYRMTVRNSAAACRWLVRLAPKWHLEAATSG